jgi:hypothetical protein
MQITICGGGNAAHTLAGLLGSRPDLSVNIYAPFQDEAERWQIGLKQNDGILVHAPGRDIVGRPVAVFRDPAQAVQGSEFILLALPAFAHEIILRQIEGYLSPDTWVGALPARAGFDLCVRDILKDRLSHINIFGFQTLPWACRIQEYGGRVSILGVKAQVDLAALPAKLAPVISSRMGELLGVVLNPISNFLSLTLADTGQLIHPGIMYGLFHNWNGQAYSEPSLFYQAVDEEVAAILQNMSQEVQALRSILEQAYPGLDLTAVRPVGEWLKRSYPTSIKDSSTLHSSFATNRSYTGLLAPMIESENGFVPDFQSRYLTEDMPYGLLVMRGIAELAGVAMPMVDEVVFWAQSRLGKRYMVEGKLQGAELLSTRTPQRYGYDNLNQFMLDFQYMPMQEKAGGLPATRH